MKILIVFLLMTFTVRSEEIPFSDYSFIDTKVTRDGDNKFRLNIPTLGDGINLTLTQLENVFVDNVEQIIAVEGDDDEDDGIKDVQGIVVKDHFTGHFALHDGLFYIEPAAKFQLGDRGGILYKVGDIAGADKQDYAREIFANNVTITNYTDTVKDTNVTDEIVNDDKVNNETYYDENVNDDYIKDDNIKNETVNDDIKDENIKNETVNDDIKDDIFMVKEYAALRNKSGSRTGNICMMEITVDKFLFAKLGNDKVKVEALIQRHVATLNKVYAANKIIVNNKQIIFKVKDVVIHDEEFCMQGNKRYTHVACKKWFLNSDDSFLAAYAAIDHSAYCLSFLFTTHNFHTTLGVAYKRSICKPYKLVNLEDKLEVLSPNVGFITLHGSLTDATSEQTFCHEVGHSLGANHDQEDGCGAGFLMDDETKNFAKKIPIGHNSYTFSPCSRAAIEKAVAKFEKDPTRQCLVDSGSWLTTLTRPAVMMTIIWSSVALLSIIALVLIILLCIKRRNESDPDVERKYSEFSNKAFINDDPHGLRSRTSSQSHILPSRASSTRKLHKSASTTRSVSSPQIQRAPSPSPSPTYKTSSMAWMVGEMTRERAERQLMNRGIGEFLVRKSQGELVLTMVNNGRFSHVKIDNGKDGYTIDRIKYFNTVLDMVNFYINNPISTVGVKLVLDHPSYV